MKTQILRLETHDTVTSICDKLAWAQSPRILLAFPRRRPPLLGRIDLTLIQRGAARVGGQLAISTLDAKISEAARIVGIPVFPSIPAAQRLSWRSRDRRRARSFQPRTADSLSSLHEQRPSAPATQLPNWLRVSVFSLGVAAVFALSALFLPSASIEFPVTAQTQTLDLTVYPGVGIPGVLPGGQIPAVEIQTIVEGQLETAATGEILVPDQSAQALVTVTNQTEQAVSMPAGTVLLAQGAPSLRFATLTSVDLPAGRGEQVDVQVRAEAPGSSGNVTNGSINTIEGSIGLLVTVANSAPAEGGSDRPGRAASEQDYAQLYDSLLTSLTGTALSRLITDNPQLMVVPESLVVNEVLEEVRQPSVGQPSDRIRLSLKVVFSSLAVSRTDLNAVATAALDANLANGQTPLANSLSITQKDVWMVIPGQRLTLDLQAARSTTPILNTTALFTEIRGLIVGDAGRLIQNQMNLSQTPTIRTSPAWWPRLPLLPFRIQAESS